ncbi:MAG: formylglycine-generating enzyme family protein [Rhizobiaceae bacterium]
MQNRHPSRLQSGAYSIKSAVLSFLAVLFTLLATPLATSQEKETDRRGVNSRPNLSTFTDCDTCPEMVVIPGGEFKMGSSSDEKGRGKNEGPQRKVAITRFALAKTEVTFEQWDRCVLAGGCSEDAASDGAAWGRGKRPAMNISWNDAHEYISWLNANVTGAPYRLPSEAEWEYAARAGTQTPFAFGNTLSVDQANYNGNFSYGSGEEGVNRQMTVPVDELDAANAWGLRHMHGNVWEWVEDCQHESYRNAPLDGTPWLSSQNGDCAIRMRRGGDWSRPPWELRSAARHESGLGFRYFKIGFRLARTLSP